MENSKKASAPVMKESKLPEKKAGVKEVSKESAKPVSKSVVPKNQEDNKGTKASKVKTDVKTEAKTAVKPVQDVKPVKAESKLEKDSTRGAESQKKSVAKKSTAKKSAKTVAEKDSKLKKVVKKSEKIAKKVNTPIKVSTFIQYQGREIEQCELVQKVKENWIAQGNEENSIEKLELYVKPEENAVYYVVNGMIDSGKVFL